MHGNVTIKRYPSAQILMTIHALLVFYLNTTHSVRPHPKSINRQLFNKIDTPPEIFLVRNLDSKFFAGDTLLKELGEQYSMYCYYSEELDETDCTYWHYLYFIDIGRLL